MKRDEALKRTDLGSADQLTAFSNTELNELLPVQLPLFTIETSIEDILNQRSGFNPFPEQAVEGISVWGIFRSNNVTIRYEATGNMYHTHIPWDDPINEIAVPTPLAEEPASYYNQDGERITRWIPQDRFLALLSENLVSGEEDKGKIAPFLNEAVVKSYATLEGGKKQPVFETPDDAYLKIVKAATLALDHGKWREAVGLVRYGHRVGAYNIEGYDSSQEASRLFRYSTRQLAFDAVPSLIHDFPGANEETGKRDVVSDTASEVGSLIFYTIRERALQTALQEYEGSPAAQGHLETTLEKVRARKARVEQDLADKKSLGGTPYIDQVKEYFEANGTIPLTEKQENGIFIGVASQLRFDTDPIEDCVINANEPLRLDSEVTKLMESSAGVLFTLVRAIRSSSQYAPDGAVHPNQDKKFADMFEKYAVMITYLLDFFQDDLEKQNAKAGLVMQIIVKEFGFVGSDLQDNFDKMYKKYISSEESGKFQTAPRLELYPPELPRLVSRFFRSRSCPFEYLEGIKMMGPRGSDPETWQAINISAFYLD